jgi:hypothetical protein
MGSTTAGNEKRDVELELKRFDSFVGAFGAIGVVASIFFGFSQQTEATKSQTQATRDQWSQKFYEEKLAAYLRATEAAARIAALKTSSAEQSKVDEAILQFRVQYWGPMCITEGHDVEQAMVYFNDGIKRGLEAEGLEQLALYLAHVCKNEAHMLYNLDRPGNSERNSNPYYSTAQLLFEMKQIVCRNSKTELPGYCRDVPSGDSRDDAKGVPCSE